MENGEWRIKIKQLRNQKTITKRSLFDLMSVIYCVSIINHAGI